MNKYLAEGLGVCAFVLLPAPLLAQGLPAERVQGWYAGGSIGYSSVYSTESIASGIDKSEKGDGSTSWSATGGYRFWDVLAAEVTYRNFGELGWDGGIVFDNQLMDDFYSDSAIDLTAWQFTGLALLPLGDMWEVYIRGGLSSWRARGQQTLTPLLGGADVVRPIDDDGVSFMFGAGFGVTFERQLEFRFEYSTQSIDDDLLQLTGDLNASADTFSLQAYYRFGSGWPVRNKDDVDRGKLPRPPEDD